MHIVSCYGIRAIRAKKILPWATSGHRQILGREVYKHIADIMAKYLHDLPKIHIVNKTRPPIKPAPPIVPAPLGKLFTKTRGD